MDARVTKKIKDESQEITHQEHVEQAFYRYLDAHWVKVFGGRPLLGIP